MVDDQSTTGLADHDCAIQSSWTWAFVHALSQLNEFGLATTTSIDDDTLSVEVTEPAVPRPDGTAKPDHHLSVRTIDSVGTVAVQTATLDEFEKPLVRDHLLNADDRDGLTEVIEEWVTDVAAAESMPALSTGMHR